MFTADPVFLPKVGCGSHLDVSSTSRSIRCLTRHDVVRLRRHCGTDFESLAPLIVSPIALLNLFVVVVTKLHLTIPLSDNHEANDFDSLSSAQ